jgi:hypothetical protein
MDYRIRYEKNKGQSPWSVYGVSDDDGREIFKKGFTSHLLAEEWVSSIRDAGPYHAMASGEKKNGAIDEASRESFPASDPPSWTGSTAGQA